VLAIFVLGNPYARADDWTRSEIAGEILWQALHLIDWGHTRYIADNPDEYYEINPILGDHPDKRRVDTYMAVSALLHPVITGILPKETEILGFKIKPRAIWQSISIGISAGLVMHNASIGIQIEF
jgi:hypothetical protein